MMCALVANIGFIRVREVFVRNYATNPYLYIKKTTEDGL